ncbi:MAG: peptidase M4 [Nevskiaceae bacterium]|nr:MAG: peptidase M4 [Nevskiaceae bacterium]TBR71836.1 MAG: peptidase M4 [Nevskiaceae bacterium]
MPTIKSSRVLTAAIVIAVAAVSSGAFAESLDGHQYLKDAKITLSEARATALNVVPGKIVAEELEKESGGSGLRYSFDIKKDQITHEVGVDAETGKILENSVEGPNAD